MVKAYDETQEPIPYAFKVLDQVAQNDYTKWQVVYDLSKKRIQFRTRRNNQLRSIDLSDFDFVRGSDAMVLNVNSRDRGPLGGKFKPYTVQFNDSLMSECLREFRKAGMMSHITPQHVRYIRAVVASCNKVDSGTKPEIRN